MSESKNLLESFSWKFKDTFFVNLMVGFLIFNYDFLYVLFSQPVASKLGPSEFFTAKDVINEANDYLDICEVFLYALLVTFLYPWFSTVVVKWKRFVDYCKERWLDKSFPTNEQYKKKIDDLVKLESELESLASNFGSRMVEECQRSYNDQNMNWHFSVVKGAPHSSFKEGDIVVLKNFGTEVKLTHIRNFKNESSTLKFVYCKVKEDLYVIADVRDVCFQPKSLIEGTFEFLVLTRDGVKLCEEHECERLLSEQAPNVIFSMKRNTLQPWSSVKWNITS